MNDTQDGPRGLALSSARVLSVVGMHRSGTSLVAGLIAASGIDVGDKDDLYGPDRHNEYGYFEHRAVVELNDELLREAGGTWWSPPAAAALRPRPDWVARAREVCQAAGISSSKASLSVLKDPRMSLMWPVWDAALRRNVYPILAVRHPVDVADSLWLRDGMPLPVGLALWERYLCSLLEDLGHQQTEVVHYESLVDQTGEAQRWLAQLLKSTGSDDGGGRADAACEHLLRADVATRGTDEASASEVLTRHQQRLWEALHEVPTGSQIAASDLRDIFRYTRSAEASLAAYGERTRLLHGQSEELRSLHQEEVRRVQLLESLREEGTQAQARERDLSEKLVYVTAQLSETTAACSDLERRLATEEARAAEHARAAEDLEGVMATCGELERSLARERAQGEDLLRRVASQEALADDSRRKEQGLLLELERARAQSAYGEASLEKVRASVSELSERLREAMTQRERALGQLDRTVIESRAEIHRLGTDMHLMHESATWRVGRSLVGPLAWLKRLVSGSRQ